MTGPLVICLARDADNLVLARASRLRPSAGKLFPPNKLDRKCQLQHVKGSADAKSWTRENSWWVGANLVQEKVELIASRRAWGSTAVLAGH